MINDYEKMIEDTGQIGRGKSYYIFSFGCQMNEHDSEVLEGMLRGLAYCPAADPQEADLIVINTCAVRRKPEEKVTALLGRLKPLKQQNPDLIIAVGGCMVQQKGMPESLARRFGYIDLIFGTHALPGFPHLLEQAGGRRQPLIDVGEYPGCRTRQLPVRRASRFKAWLPVIYGCNNYCSYCIVPYVRGRETSRPKDLIISEASALARDGYLELTLLGQNVNSYGLDLPEGGPYGFADLLLDLNRIQGISRIRFLTSHPKDISAGLIEAVRDAEKVCEHIHLPVQTGSNRLLKAMNRNYTRERYLELIANIKQEIVGAAVTTDIIVGYPGETDNDFYQTLELVKEARFDNAFIFLYSPRSGTRATKTADSLSVEEKKRRMQEISRVQNGISREINQGLVGTRAEVLVEGTSKRNPRMQSGRTRTGKLVHFSAGKDLAGKLVEVSIKKACTWHLIGETAEKTEKETKEVYS